MDKESAMMCSDTYNGSSVVFIRPPREAYKGADARLNALPPCLRKHFLESVQDNKEMLEELAKM